MLKSKSVDPSLPKQPFQNAELNAAFQTGYKTFENQIATGQFQIPAKNNEGFKKINKFQRFVLQGLKGMKNGTLETKVGQEQGQFLGSLSAAGAAYSINKFGKPGEVDDATRDKAYTDLLANQKRSENNKQRSLFGSIAGAVLGIAAVAAVLTFPPLAAVFAPISSAVGGGFAANLVIGTIVSLPVSLAASAVTKRLAKKSDSKLEELAVKDLNTPDQDGLTGRDRLSTSFQSQIDIAEQFEREQAQAAAAQQPQQQLGQNYQQNLIPANQTAANHSVSQASTPSSVHSSASVNSNRSMSR